jgi:uroporphyrinogen decarboxylase
MAGEDRAVQGNLDPTALLGTPESLDHEIRRVLQEAGHRSGHIFNLGHGILPETSVDQARRVVDRVHQWSAR